ncbi:hypothetical protein RJ55_04849 [Drechmeria coniospora]|nr:hypothetical protein RJ55_04849 [Drechmeria coniospora]
MEEAAFLGPAIFSFTIEPIPLDRHSRRPSSARLLGAAGGGGSSVDRDVGDEQSAPLSWRPCLAMAGEREGRGGGLPLGRQTSRPADEDDGDAAADGTCGLRRRAKKTTGSSSPIELGEL